MNLNFSSDVQEDRKIRNLLHLLKEKDKEFVEAIEAEESLNKIRKLEIEYVHLVKQINNISAELNLDLKVKENLNKEYEQYNLRQFQAYREKHEISEQIEIAKFDDSLITPIPTNKNVPFVLRPSKFHSKSKLQGTSTPIENPIAQAFCETPKRTEITTIPKNNLTTVFENSVIERIESIKEELSSQVETKALADYFTKEENLAVLNQTFKQDFAFRDIVGFVKDQIYALIKPSEEIENVANLTRAQENSRESTHFISAVENLSGIENNIEDEMTQYSMRGLSMRDALDLIPRFNGANISLSQFLDGCTEARSIIPPAYEAEFMKLIRMRLYGEALNIARARPFSNLKELSDFFEKMFGSSKTYHDLMGELAKIRQGKGEAVVMYLNRLKEIEKEIRKAAQKEDRIINEECFTGLLERDCLKYFMRGLRWEIKAQMGIPSSYSKAQEEAIETEREFACSLFDSQDNRDVCDSSKNGQETKKINLVAADTTKPVCAYCKRIGHTATNCITLARNLNAPQNRGDQFQSSYRNNQYNPNPTRQNENFNKWNANNQGRPNFFSNRNNYNSHRNNFYNDGNPSNYNMNHRSAYDDQQFVDAQDNPPGNFGDNRIMRNQVNNFSNQGRSNLGNITCHFCGKIGHVQRNCFAYQRQIRPNQTTQGNGISPPLLGARREESGESPPIENVPIIASPNTPA